jgi:lactate 2-monooxygenase
MSQNFGDFQNEIYLAGLGSRQPKYPVDFATLERKAEEVMPASVRSYVAGGCGDEFTQRQNTETFHRYGIAPRVLASAPKRDLTINLFRQDASDSNFYVPDRRRQHLHD